MPTSEVPFLPCTSFGALCCLPEAPRAREAEGADSMKALLLAMQMVSANLYGSAWHAAGLIAFDTPGAG